MNIDKDNYKGISINHNNSNIDKFNRGEIVNFNNNNNEIAINYYYYYDLRYNNSISNGKNINNYNNDINEINNNNNNNNKYYDDDDDDDDDDNNNHPLSRNNKVVNLSRFSFPPIVFSLLGKGLNFALALKRSR